jgi:transcriptional regulator with XRE-family HTH domain/Zn-dependent peptidase ImmA (M78 family)
MNSTTDQLRAWDEAAYQQLDEVSFDGSVLHVRFANDDLVSVDPARLVTSSTASDADWTAVRIAGAELMVPVPGDEIAVSGFDIRALTDGQFARHLAQLAEEQGRLVGQRIRTLRESRGLSSAELSRRAGISAQSLSRIELGRHDVVYSTLQRILAAMNYSLADLAATPEPELDLRTIVRRLKQVGLPSALIERLTHAARPALIAERLQQIFGWSAADLASDSVLALRSAPGLAAQFKADVRQRPAEGAYVLYAYYIGLLAAQAARPAQVNLPRTADEIRREVVARSGAVTFETLLSFAWDSGVIVVPLADPGQFHGACWMFDGRPIVVLKQTTNSDARYAFDLAHELGHLALHFDARTTAVVETGELHRSRDAGEREASVFAGEVLLGDPEALAQSVVARANRHGPRLKQATIDVARDARVSVGALANYLAFRLTDDIPSWWGVANNLQEPTSAPPFAVAREALLRNVDLGRLDADDRLLVEEALADTEEHGG